MHVSLSSLFICGLFDLVTPLLRIAQLTILPIAGGGARAGCLSVFSAWWGARRFALNRGGVRGTVEDMC
jgi:hypothetical protein